jgi:hypothetical protein
MKDKERFLMYVKIAQRAEGMDLYTGDRFTFLMDVENADEQFNMRLEDWLNADDFNFAHDVVGIVNNINRQTKEFGLFVPRFAK